MRNTSYRRRTGLKVHPLPYTSGPTRTFGKDLTVPVGTPGSVRCGVCDANVPALVTGRPKGHAAGGVVANTRRGRYTCEGSGKY